VQRINLRHPGKPWWLVWVSDIKQWFAARQHFLEDIAVKAMGKMAGRCSLYILLGVLLLFSVGSSPPAVERQTLSPEVTAVSDGNSSFALSLLSKLAATSNANEVLSPFSISCVFAIVYAGARGTTESQIATVLQFPTNQTSLHMGMAGILSSFTNLNNEAVELQVKNGIWVQSGYQITSEFLDIGKTYTAELESVDFKTSGQSVAQRINGWAEGATRGKIRNLFGLDGVTANTRLVLANAVYFKGNWAKQFDKRKTSARPFWVASG
jgi:serpin B